MCVCALCVCACVCVCVCVCVCACVCVIHVVMHRRCLVWFSLTEFSDVELSHFFALSHSNIFTESLPLTLEYSHILKHVYRFKTNLRLVWRVRRIVKREWTKHSHVSKFAQINRVIPFLLYPLDYQSSSSFTPVPPTTDSLCKPCFNNTFIWTRNQARTESADRIASYLHSTALTPDFFFPLILFHVIGGLWAPIAEKSHRKEHIISIDLQIEARLNVVWRMNGKRLALRIGNTNASSLFTWYHSVDEFQRIPKKPVGSLQT